MSSCLQTEGSVVVTPDIQLTKLVGDDRVFVLRCLADRAGSILVKIYLGVTPFTIPFKASDNVKLVARGS